MGIFNRKKKMPVDELLKRLVGCVAIKTVERIENDIHHMMGYRFSQATTNAYGYLETQGIERKVQQAVVVSFTTLIAKLHERDIQNAVQIKCEITPVLKKYFRFEFDSLIEDVVKLDMEIWREIGTHQNEAFFYEDCKNQDSIYWKLPKRVFDFISENHDQKKYINSWLTLSITRQKMMSQAIGMLVRETVKEIQPILDNHKIV
jgi:hypothetical protein